MCVALTCFSKKKERYSESGPKIQPVLVSSTAFTTRSRNGSTELLVTFLDDLLALVLKMKTQTGSS